MLPDECPGPILGNFGGFSLGLERAGMKTVAFCEIDPYCRRVLAKHWPDIPIHDDIRELDGEQYRGTVDVVCGGWPCQAFSTASRGRKTAQNMWPEYARIIREVRPRFVIAENVTEANWNNVRVCLGSMGYITHSHDFHVPFRRHKRHRTYLVADANGDSESGGAIHEKMAELLEDAGGFWPALPDIVGMDDGIPSRVDRLRALGNAVIPQIPEIIGRAINDR